MWYRHWNTTTVSQAAWIQLRAKWTFTRYSFTRTRKSYVQKDRNKAQTKIEATNLKHRDHPTKAYSSKVKRSQMPLHMFIFCSIENGFYSLWQTTRCHSSDWSSAENVVTLLVLLYYYYCCCRLRYWLAFYLHVFFCVSFPYLHRYRKKIWNEREHRKSTTMILWMDWNNLNYWNERHGKRNLVARFE